MKFLFTFFMLFSTNCFAFQTINNMDELNKALVVDPRILFIILADVDSPEWKQYEKVIKEYEKKMDSDVEFIVSDSKSKDFKEFADLAKANNVTLPATVLVKNLNRLGNTQGSPGSVEELSSIIDQVKFYLSAEEIKQNIEEDKKNPPPKSKKKRNSSNYSYPRDAKR